MRDFCAETGMRCGTEMIRMDAVYAAQARRGRGNVRDRLVIDMQGLRDQTAA